MADILRPTKNIHTPEIENLLLNLATKYHDWARKGFYSVGDIARLKDELIRLSTSTGGFILNEPVYYKDALAGRIDAYPSRRKDFQANVDRNKNAIRTRIAELEARRAAQLLEQQQQREREKARDAALAEARRREAENDKRIAEARKLAAEQAKKLAVARTREKARDIDIAKARAREAQQAKEIEAARRRESEMARDIALARTREAQKELNALKKLALQTSVAANLARSKAAVATQGGIKERQIEAQAARDEVKVRVKVVEAAAKSQLELTGKFKSAWKVAVTAAEEALNAEQLEKGRIAKALKQINAAEERFANDKYEQELVTAYREKVAFIKQQLADAYDKAQEVEVTQAGLRTGGTLALAAGAAGLLYYMGS